MKKTTQELLEMMKSKEDYQAYLKETHGELEGDYMRVGRALQILMAEKKLKKADVIARSGVEVHYAYQIFSDSKVPKRDKVLMLGIGAGICVEEMQQLLRVTGYPPLYGKIPRDNAILFGITKELSVIDINNLLYEMGLELLL